MVKGYLLNLKLSELEEEENEVFKIDKSTKLLVEKFFKSMEKNEEYAMLIGKCKEDNENERDKVVKEFAEKFAIESGKNKKIAQQFSEVVVSRLYEVERKIKQIYTFKKTNEIDIESNYKNKVSEDEVNLFESYIEINKH